jgi:hypothetical protein
MQPAGLLAPSIISSSQARLSFGGRLPWYLKCTGTYGLIQIELRSAAALDAVVPGQHELLAAPQLRGDDETAGGRARDPRSRTPRRVAP